MNFHTRKISCEAGCPHISWHNGPLEKNSNCLENLFWRADFKCFPDTSWRWLQDIPGPLSEVPGVARSAMMARTMGTGCRRWAPGLRLAKSNLKGVPLLEADGSQWGWTAPMALELGPRPLSGPHIHILPNPLFWPPPSSGPTHPDQFRSGTISRFAHSGVMASS